MPIIIGMSFDFKLDVSADCSFNSHVNCKTIHTLKNPHEIWTIKYLFAESQNQTVAYYIVILHTK